MTREEIIALAKQHSHVSATQFHFYPDQLEAFFHAAQRMERERIADDLEHEFVDDEGHHIQYAAAIRNRTAS